MTTLAERIIDCMEKRGLSVTDVARECGLSYQAIRKLRMGYSQSMDGLTLVKMSRLFEVEPDWLMLGTAPRVRVYARNEAQSNTLTLMQAMPADEQHKVPEIAYLLGQRPKKEGNGWQ